MLVAPLCVQRQRDQEAQQEEDAAAHLRAPPSRQPRGQFSLKSCISRVRPFNLGLHFLASKAAFSCPSVGRYSQKMLGLINLS